MTQQPFSPADILPDDVYKALSLLVEYQESRNWTINMHYVGPIAENHMKLPRRLIIKIENMPRKLVKNCIQAGAREGFSGITGVAEVYHHCTIAGSEITLQLVGNREKLTKEAIAATAQKSGKANAEWIADQLMKERGIEP